MNIWLILVCACQFFTITIFFLLFQQEYEDTLLTMAARRGIEDIVQLLLNAGADIEARNKVN